MVVRNAIQKAISVARPNHSVRTFGQRSDIRPPDLSPKLAKLTLGPRPKAALVTDPNAAIAAREQRLDAMNRWRSRSELFLGLHEKILIASADPKATFCVRTNTEHKSAARAAWNRKALTIAIVQAVQAAAVSADPNSAVRIFGDRYGRFSGGGARAASAFLTAFG